MKKNNLIKKMISLLCAILLTVSTVLAGLPGNVFASADNAPPTDFTEIGWTDFKLNCEKYTAAAGALAAEGTYLQNSLHETLLNANIIMGKDSYIRYGGSSGWPGLHIAIAADAQMSYIVLSNQLGGTVISGNEYLTHHQAVKFEIDTLVDKEFNLKISTEISGDNYTFGVWVNDIMVGGYITVTAADGWAGAKMGLVPNGGSITLAEKENTPLSDFKEIDWSGFNLENKEYSSQHAVGGLNASGNYSPGLNETLLNGDIIMGKTTDIRFAAENGWEGLRIYVDGEGKIGLDVSALGTISSGAEYFKTYEPTDFGLTTFIDEQFNLKISTEISGNRYTFGIWVNDIMLGGYVTVVASKGGNYIGFYDYDGSGESITLKNHEILPPDDFTELAWTDFESLQYQEYADVAGTLAGYGTYSESLHQTLLDDEITFGADTEIRYGGQNWGGLTLWVESATSFVVRDTSDARVGEFTNPNEYGLTSFADEKFNLKISTEISGTSYTFGVWINDKSAGSYTLDLGTAGGSVLDLYGRGSGNSITLGTVEKNPLTDFTELTWKDLGFEYKEYPAVQGDLAASGTYEGTSLHETLLNDNIIIGANTDIRYAGTNGWSGLRLNIVADESTSYLSLELNGYGTVTAGSEYLTLYPASTFEVDTLVGEQFNLKISTEIAGDSYTFGVWVNDVMAGDYITITAAEGMAGNMVGLYAHGEPYDSITLGTPETNPPTNPDTPPTNPDTPPTNPDTPPTNPDTPPATGTVKPPTDFTELTWKDLGFAYKEYPAVQGDLTASGTYTGASLHETLLNDNIIIGANTDIRYAGTNGWGGLRLNIVADESTSYLSLELNGYGTVTAGSQYLTLYPASVFDTDTLVGEQFNLKISTEIAGNSYTFGVWINGVMAGDYITITVAEGMAGNMVGLYAHDNPYDSITLGTPETNPPADQDVPSTNPDTPPATGTVELPTDFTELSWEDFGLQYKEYPAVAGNLAGKGTYVGSLDKTLLNGDIVFGKGTDIRYAGNGWSGILLEVAHDGSVLYVNGSTFDGSYIKEYYPADYGLVSFADTEFNLKISTEMEGDNYTFGIWVNDKILGNYFTLTQNVDTAAGTSIGLYDRGSNNSIILAGEPKASVPSEPIPVPKDYTVVTLDDFEGTIRPGFLASDTPVLGQLKEQTDFDKIVFDADINIASKAPGDETYLRFAGSEGGWVGIGFETRADGTLILMNWTSAEMLQSYTKDVAGFDFFKEAFNLKVSFAYVDSDKDGNEDDVQIGVYFNDVLYNNKLVVVKDYKMTNYLLAYTDDADKHPLEISIPKEKELALIQPDESLKKISFSSFNIADAEFTKIDVENFCAFGSYRDLVKGKTLDGTLFHGKVKFGENGGSQIRYGGLKSEWCGLIFLGNADGTISLVEAESDTPEKQFSYLFNSYEAGCELVGVWLDLKISIQFVDYDKDGKADDVQLGIWFNDMLYRNEYIYLCDYAQHMGSNLSVYSSNKEGYIAIQSVEVDNEIELTLYGFDDNYKAYFKSSEKDTVQGVPLGVTAEYDTVDYHVEAKQGVSEDVSADDTDAPNEKKIPYGVLILAGTGAGLVLAGSIFWILKKRKSNNEHNSNT